MFTVSNITLIVFPYTASMVICYYKAFESSFVINGNFSIWENILGTWVKARPLHLNQLAKEDNKFSRRKKLCIQLNAFINTNKIVQIPVDDREKDESVFIKNIDLRKYIMLAKYTVQEILSSSIESSIYWWSLKY